MVAINPNERVAWNHALFRPYVVAGGRLQPEDAIAVHARWERFTGARQQEIRARISGFRSDYTDDSGFTHFRWKKPSDALPLELTVDVEKGDPDLVIAEVWTNANNNADPLTYYAVDMGRPDRTGNRLTFRLDLPVEKAGSYHAVGRISTDGGVTWKWMREFGIEQDLLFRTRAVEHEAKNIREIHVGMANYDFGKNALSFSTLEELTEGGAYGLEKLAADGINTIWLMCPFFTSRWEGCEEEDDAGSPFATRDYFSIDPRLSSAARQIPEEDEERRREVALAAFQRMVDRAKELGIEVVLDIALNHAGHDFIFRDLFETERGLEVQKNNFSQIAVNQAQLDHVERMLADPKVKAHEKKYMEYLFPWAYAKWDAANGRPDPDGAQRLEEMVVGGWGATPWLNWRDTKQWGHGASWYAGFVRAQSEQQLKMLGWYERILTFWSSVVGVSGFRLDHGQGLPDQFYDLVLNRVQAAADVHRPGMNVFVMPEDHNRSDFTRHFTDAIQTCGWTEHLLHATKHSDPDRLWWVLTHPYFKQPVGSPSHDEPRIGNAFGGDLKAAARYQAFSMLLGGPSITLMGDEYGEGEDLKFKRYRGVPTLWLAQTGKLPLENQEMSRTMSKAGRLKNQEPALRTANRARLVPENGDRHLMGAARHADGGERTVLVFGNFHDQQSREGRFRLDAETLRRIDPDARYQVWDLMGDPAKALWAEPIRGTDLVQNGLWVRLEAYQLQALALDKV